MGQTDEFNGRRRPRRQRGERRGGGDGGGDGTKAKHAEKSTGVCEAGTFDRPTDRPTVDTIHPPPKNFTVKSRRRRRRVETRRCLHPPRHQRLHVRDTSRVHTSSTHQQPRPLSGASQVEANE